MRINNPLPSSLASECKKCSKILASFIDPSQAFGPDKFIPPHVLVNAKGLVILSVFKAGFLGSARYGNGVVVARLLDGSWSAPSAIGTGGAGFGGQIGFELTDFVFILNDSAAVRTFSQVGSLTLGGNVSVAVGPLGRNAEAAGAASLKGVAGIFSYSKTKGIFAGVSLEGSAIVERRDANEKLYGQRLTASQLLAGSVPPPLAAQPLINILNSGAFVGYSSGVQQTYYDTSISSSTRPAEGRESRIRNALCSGLKRSLSRSVNIRDFKPTRQERRPSHLRTMEYENSDLSYPENRNPSAPRAGVARVSDEYVYSDTPQNPENQVPGRPPAPKPIFKSRTGNLKKNEAVAIYSFQAEQPGDLSFKKGAIITVTHSSSSKDDWWTGTIGTQTGIFPANYVEIKT